MSFHIIDDQPAVRMILSAFIEHDGHETLSFESAETYLEYFSSPAYAPPTAILTDYMMPGMNGYALATYIRRQAPFQKIVVISAMADAADEANSELCYTLGKPFTRESVSSLVRALVACQHACMPGIRCYAHAMCEFGLDYPCPFAPSA